MKKMIVLLFVLLLAGCGAEEITGTFTLDAAQGYVQQDDYETPKKYIIERNYDKVFVDKNVEGFTEEELAAWGDMSPEERADFIDNQPAQEGPIYDITLIEATTEEIVLEYEGERVVFTALSESYFKADDGTQYIIEYDSPSIAEYEASLMGP